MDHVVIYLDAFTLGLITAWEHERCRHWPDSSHPHSLVPRNTVVDDSGPPIDAALTQSLSRSLG